VEVVGYECPCIAACICFGNDTPNSIQKAIAISIIDKELPPLDYSNDDVMERSGSIYSGFSWHDVHIALLLNTVNYLNVK